MSLAGTKTGGQQGTLSGGANNPQAQLLHDKRDDPGSGELSPVEDYAIPRLPDRPQDRKQPSVQHRGVHAREASRETI
jgi:hypothetical protein